MPPFRLAVEMVHLTYKTHMQETAVKAMLEAKGMLKIYSFVHEVGDEDEDYPTLYNHTHVFAYWTKRLDLTDCRTFDVNGIHPAMTTRRSIQWAKQIVCRYHRGHKTEASGKEYYMEPVYINQQGVEDWKFAEELWDRIAGALSLRDACLEADIVPRSTRDVDLIRRDAKKRKLNPPRFRMDSFNLPPLDLSKPVLLHGPTHTGKTQYALAHFKNALLVTHHEGCRHFDPDVHDGIVFEDVTFDAWKDATVKHLLDMEVDFEMEMRHMSYVIPAGTKKIFTANSAHIFLRQDPGPVDEAIRQAVTRRYRAMHIGDALYS